MRKAKRWFVLIANAERAGLALRFLALVLVAQVQILLAASYPPAGIVGWWEAEGNALDSMSHTPAVVHGDLTYAPGKVGSAFAFNGTNAHATVPALTTTNLGSFSVELWIYGTADNLQQPLLEFADATGFPGVHLWVNTEDWNPLPTPGRLYANLQEYAEPYPYMHVIKSPVGVLGTNQWAHVALTWDQATGVAQLFVNGTNVATEQFGNIIPNTALPLNLGYRPAGSAGPAGSLDAFAGRRFQGRLDEISIYDRALATAEIQAIYAAGAKGKTHIPTPTDITFTPPGGTFTDFAEVTLVNTIGAGILHYTIDGTIPTPASPLYTNPILLSTNAAIKARVFLGSYPISEICSQTYVINPAPSIRMTPDGGLFTNSIVVLLNNVLGVGQIHYTLDGTVPNAMSPVYTSGLKLTAQTVISARIFINEFPTSDVVAREFSRVYAIDDGIPNSWREKYFGPQYLTDPRVGADSDPDQDGAGNRQEYMTGTDPLDPSSGFWVSIQAIPCLRWRSESNQVYRVLRNHSVNQTNWTEVARITATNSVSSYYDAEMADPTAFYVIEPVR